MKLKLVSWFLFFLQFSQMVSRSACDTTFSLTHAGSELSENIRGKQSDGSNATTIGMDKERRGEGYEVVKIVHAKGGGQRGPGGGSDVNRKPPRTNNSTASISFPAIPSLVIGLLLVFHFFF